jgi:hypothetical protein
MATFLPLFSTFFNIGFPSWPFTAVSWQTIELAPVNGTPVKAGLPRWTEAQISLNAKAVGRLPVRLRWSPQCVIVEWELSRIATTPNFILYRGSKPSWEVATILDLSIFVANDSQTEKIYYSAVDRKATAANPSYYWILMSTSHHCEQRFGPFMVA